MGFPLSLFLLYIPLGELVWVSIYLRFVLIFDPWNFLSPGGWTQHKGSQLALRIKGEALVSKKEFKADILESGVKLCSPFHDKFLVNKKNVTISLAL